jgi:hypothetical protein
MAAALKTQAARAYIPMALSYVELDAKSGSVSEYTARATSEYYFIDPVEKSG